MEKGIRSADGRTVLGWSKDNRLIDLNLDCEWNVSCKRSCHEEDIQYMLQDLVNFQSYQKLEN